MTDSSKGSPSAIPRIVIDARMVGPVPHGFARYVSRLAEGLDFIREGAELPYEPVFLLSGEEGVPPVFAHFPRILCETRFLHPTELIELPRTLRAAGAALYHSPTFASLGSCPCPWLVTVHDLNHLEYGGWKERAYYRWLLRPFARRARKLLTVSEFSKRALRDWVPLSPEAIEVVPNALDPALRARPTAAETEELLARLGLRRGRFFFSLTNSKPHKNVPFLLEAYRAYSSSSQAASPRPLQSPDSADGRWPLALSVKGFAATDGVRQLGPVEDREASILMHAAGAVVFPSLYEGFGLPPVEAASLGIPVIVSDIPAHREALQDLGPAEVRWASPASVPEWSAALLAAARGELRPPMPTSQEKLWERYSVPALGRRMDRIYRSVLGISL